MSRQRPREPSEQEIQFRANMRQHKASVSARRVTISKVLEQFADVEYRFEGNRYDVELTSQKNAVLDALRNAGVVTGVHCLRGYLVVDC
jgi:hypothetical protein